MRSCQILRRVAVLRAKAIRSDDCVVKWEHYFVVFDKSRLFVPFFPVRLDKEKYVN